MNPPITKENVRNHFYYHWWMYLLIIAASFFLWNLLYTTTHYKAPENKRIDWYYQGNISNSTEANVLQWMNAQLPSLPGETEECSIVQAGTDASYGVMQLTTWIAASQGDLYQLNEEQFKQFADAEAFADLSPYIQNGTLQADGLKLLTVKTEEGKEIIAGIYADELKGLQELGLSGDGMILGVLVSCGNEENTVALLNCLIRDMRESSEK